MKILRASIVSILVTLLSVFMLTSCGEDSLEKQMEDAKRDTQRAEQALTEAESNLDRVYELKDQYEDIQKDLSQAKKGTEEYNRLVEKNNKLVNQIVKEYPEMEQYVETR